MLKHIHIENYALISYLDIDLEDGFSVLTGETGAGKSIILGALNLVMGGKADVKVITEGEQRCIIETVFDVENGGKKEEIIIRRELNQTGRSRSFINDEVASQADLKSLALRLIDIHSQHANLLLENADYQLEVVDAIAFGKNQEPIENYRHIYDEYIGEYQTLSELQAQAQKAHEDADYVQFQYIQLLDAKLEPSEDQKLDEELYLLSHAEDLKINLQDALERIDGEEHGALPLIHGIMVGDVSQSLAERLQSVEIELQDIFRELQTLEEQTEVNPMRLQAVEERIQLLNSLKKKHHVDSVDKLLDLQETLGRSCQQLDQFDERIAAQQEKVNQILGHLTKAAHELTEQRKRVCPDICRVLQKDLLALGIKHAKIDVEITPKPNYSPTGIDDIQIMFAANLNQSLRHVSEVASGGEISRLMLCIKALIASTNGLPTIIFDEIDTGVSGEIATQMGRIMRDMGQSRQIIAITHLPQIAALGTTQYLVYKEDTPTRTETHIHSLSKDERVQQIASMLSGKQQTDTAFEMAKQLLNPRDL